MPQQIVGIGKYINLTRNYQYRWVSICAVSGCRVSVCCALAFEFALVMTAFSVFHLLFTLFWISVVIPEHQRPPVIYGRSRRWEMGN